MSLEYWMEREREAHENVVALRMDGICRRMETYTPMFVAHHIAQGRRTTMFGAREAFGELGYKDVCCACCKNVWCPLADEETLRRDFEVCLGCRAIVCHTCMAERCSKCEFGWCRACVGDRLLHRCLCSLMDESAQSLDVYNPTVVYESLRVTVGVLRGAPKNIEPCVIPSCQNYTYDFHGVKPRLCEAHNFY